MSLSPTSLNLKLRGNHTILNKNPERIKVTIFDNPKDETKITGNAATNEIAAVSHISFNG